MPDSMGADFSELMQLAQDLGEVPKTAGPFIRKALEVTSVNTKKTAQASVKSGNKRFKSLPGAIDYDITVKAGVGGSSIESEIGYNLDKPAGHLGNLREYGAPGADGVPLAPHNDLLNALHENEKDFEHGLSEALKDAEKAAGL